MGGHVTHCLPSLKAMTAALALAPPSQPTFTLSCSAEAPSTFILPDPTSANLCVVPTLHPSAPIDGQVTPVAAQWQRPDSFINPWAQDLSSQAGQACEPQHAPALPAEQRRHPRRTSAPREGPPPSLVRQSNRKVAFVGKVVDSATEMISAIWPLSKRDSRCRAGAAVLQLRTFIEETLRRSRTSYSTLQLALYYVILIRPRVPRGDSVTETSTEAVTQTGQLDNAADAGCHPLACGRRMFLAALILASKYLQDRNYSANAWSKISGLGVHEINQNELSFLKAIDWRLYVATDLFEQWVDIVYQYGPWTPPPSAPQLAELAASDLVASGLAPPAEVMGDPAVPWTVWRWQKIVMGLNPRLDNLDSLLKPAVSSSPPYPPTASPLPLPMPPRTTPGLPLSPTRLSAPAASSLSCPVRGSAMAMAVAQHKQSQLSPPTTYLATRRSSAASGSITSSPESMVSDSSRLSWSSRSSVPSLSRSSSISSNASLLLVQQRLGAQARVRQAMQYLEKATAPTALHAMEPTTNSYGENMAASPELHAAWLDSRNARAAWMTQVRQARQAQHEAAFHHAARSLMELQCQGETPTPPVAIPMPRPNLKRSRPYPDDLQASVSQLLKGPPTTGSYGGDTIPPLPPRPFLGQAPQYRKRARIGYNDENDATFVNLSSCKLPPLPALLAEHA